MTSDATIRSMPRIRPLCVCMCVCIFLCMHVCCACAYVYACFYACMYVFYKIRRHHQIHAESKAPVMRMHTCMYVNIHACIHVCNMHVSFTQHLLVYMYTYICIYVRICIYVCMQVCFQSRLKNCHQHHARLADAHPYPLLLLELHICYQHAGINYTFVYAIFFVGKKLETRSIRQKYTAPCICALVKYAASCTKSIVGTTKNAFVAQNMSPMHAFSLAYMWSKLRNSHVLHTSSHDIIPARGNYKGHSARPHHISIKVSVARKRLS
jgi:hypothetical protein